MTNAAPIEICRPGRFTSVQGTVVEFTDADLAATAAAYDRDGEPAPLVIGHPKLTDAAYGWVDRLEFQGGKLVAVPADIHPAFAEAVAAKRYRRVSPEFYPPAHPNNPAPGTWSLKHVGFLGAAAPAIRGLKPVSFSEAQAEGVITIDLPAEEPPVATETDDKTAAFAEREAELDTREQAIAARETAAAEREAADAAAAATARHEANVSFAEGLIAGGKLKPFGKEKLVGLLDVLDASAVVSFGEAGELAPLDVFKDLLTSAEPFISFGEAAPPADEKLTVASFAAPAGYSVDAEALVLYQRAHAYQAEHPNVSYIDAVKAVS